jgi:guanylate kinase
MNEPTEKRVYFIAGASGVGKTSLVECLQNKYRNTDWAFLHFDSIGVPSVEEMEKEFGSPVRWQEARTYEWIDKIINEYDNQKIFLEGQVNLRFIYGAFRKHHFENFKIVLLDCSENEMAHRLIEKRKQPELVNDQMRNWLLFLKNQANELEIPVIDTSNLSEENVLSAYEKAVEL